MGDILRAEGICKTYHTGMVDVPALKKCDINIRKGEFTAIIGKVVLVNQHCLEFLALWTDRMRERYILMI